MKIEKLSHSNNIQERAFRSVYPVYHWNYSNGNIGTVFDVKMAKKCQRQILGILNHTKHMCGKFTAQFITSIHELISANDSDFAEEPCALSFYNKNAGVKTSWNGSVYKIEPAAYLLTGSDALFLEKYYRRPIGHTKADAKIYNNEEDESVKQMLWSYFRNGKDFVDKKAEDFAKKHNIELHAMFRDNQLVRMDFYQTNGVENPFVRSGYYEN